MSGVSSIPLEPSPDCALRSNRQFHEPKSAGIMRMPPLRICLRQACHIRNGRRGAVLCNNRPDFSRQRPNNRQQSTCTALRDCRVTSAGNGVDDPDTGVPGQSRFQGGEDDLRETVPAAPAGLGINGEMRYTAAASLPQRPKPFRFCEEKLRRPNRWPWTETGILS
jgi:hypothetical protein